MINQEHETRLELIKALEDEIIGHQREIKRTKLSEAKIALRSTVTELKKEIKELRNKL